MGEEGTLTFRDHLNELKHRLFLVLCNFIVGTCVGFALHKQIEAILQKPLGQTLYYSTPTGGLSFAMQIALSVGFILTLPLLLYQAMQFIRPTLKPVKTRSIVLIVLLALLLSVAAVLYVYFLSLPAALHFLVSFNSDSIQALINVNDYVRFLLAYMCGAILAFQLPLFLLFMNRVRPFPPGGLRKMQTPIIISAVIIGGIITPTIDPINQMLLAGPIIVLFEVTALSIWLANRKKRPAQPTTVVITQPGPMPAPSSRGIAHSVQNQHEETNKATGMPANSRPLVTGQQQPRLITDIIR